MGAGGTLRLFRCRASGPAFDEVLREILVPDLAARPGALAVWAGRQGPDGSGMRVVASLWSTREAMRDCLADPGPAVPGPEDVGGAEVSVDVLDALRVWADGSELSTGILRLARGELQDMDLGRYADSVAAGLEDDRRRGYGPHGLVLAAAGERSFVTVSVWSDWSRIESATGASIHEPIHTKRLAGMVAFSAEHYELLPRPTGARPG